MMGGRRVVLDHRPHAHAHALHEDQRHHAQPGEDRVHVPHPKAKSAAAHKLTPRPVKSAPAMLPVTRRLLAMLAATVLLGACASGPGAPSTLTVPRASEVAPGVYMLQGASGEVDVGNLGRIGNAGFVVGETGVVAIDTGTSHRHGMLLLAAIKAVTDKPVRLALVTHTRQEFLFGATAYREQGIEVAMHRKTAGLMKARCETCLKRLTATLGAEEMRGSAVVVPDRLFDQGHTLHDIGRPLRVMYFGHSSGPGDIAVLDEQSGVLFAGGLLDERRIPDVQDAELRGWQQALVQLSELPLTAVVPGHGPLARPAVVGAVAAYLRQLESRLIELATAGAALSEVPDATVLPAFRSWDQYDSIHRRNASIVFVRVEREQMLKQQ